MNATYWAIKDGQLKPGEAIDAGFTHLDDANKKAEELPTRYQARVGKLQTTESDYPRDDPRYETFSSARWCVIVKE